MKEETKKITKKSSPKKTTAIKKTTTKKTSAKKEPTKKAIPNLNETVNLDNSVKQRVVINNVKDSDLVECRHCHKKFESGYKICPHCHKRQTSVGLTFFIVFATAFLFGILVFHFIDKFIINRVNEVEYKDTCMLVDYENLIRHPKDYKDKDIKVIGEVVSVEGYDTGYSNDMTITINANLFENGPEQLITIEFSDTKYDQGFMEGDLITVYGKYESINGNVPDINAKFIVFGNN